MQGRKYFLDGLRVMAFAALILFHVGMLYVSWPYPLKSPRLYPAIEPWMTALSAWRLALLFLISGVASRFLIDKLGPGAFAVDRLRRLLPVILIGMLILIPPAVYAVLSYRADLHMGLFAFWWTQYLHFGPAKVRVHGMILPTWGHLWFLVYLLIYALATAGAMAAARRFGWRGGRPISPWLLLLVPPVWLVVSNLLILTQAPITDALVNDWGGHLKWIGLYLTGLLAARQDRFWALLQAHRGKTLAAAAGLLAVQLRVNDPLWSAVSGLYAWAAICALCGFARAALDRPSPWLSHLNEAVLPVYALHQPILFIAAVLVFPLRLPAGLEALTLIGPFALGRLLFGVKPKRSPPLP